MIDLAIAIGCLIGLYLLRTPKPIAPIVCPKCGGPTEHHCGMGACVEMCPKCDLL
jgi:hypothetical protein